MRTDVELTVPAGAVEREALLDRLTRLAATDHDGLEPVGRARTGPDGTLHVARCGDVATDMATVLTVRGRCSAAESSGLAVALAQGIAALHDAGVVHGPLAAADVVVDRDGRARLRPRVVVAPVGWVEADDVRALAELTAALTTDGVGDDHAALRAALAPALAAEPQVRPEAGTFAARVHDAVPPEPVRVPEPATLAAAVLGRTAGRATGATPVVGRVRHRRARRPGLGPGQGPAGRPVVGRAARRRAAAAGVRRGSGPGHRPGRVVRGPVVVAVVIAALVVGGLHLLGPADVPSPAAGSGGAGTVLDPADPAAAAQELTMRRLALLAGKGSAADVVAVGSPAEAQVAALLGDAAASGIEVVGASTTLHGTRVETGAGNGKAVVAVDYVVEAHEQRTADGTTTRVPAGPLRTAVLHLVWTADGWRVAEVG